MIGLRLGLVVSIHGVMMMMDDDRGLYQDDYHGCCPSIVVMGNPAPRIRRLKLRGLKDEVYGLVQALDSIHLQELVLGECRGAGTASAVHLLALRGRVLPSPGHP